MRTLLAVFAVASSLITVTAHAQEARGAIQGRAVDASGAAVPGASVEVLNIATGVVTPSTTNAEGSHRVPFLIPGTYRVTVTLQGFSKFVSDKIEVHVADLLTVDATLTVGGVTDEVTCRRQLRPSIARRRSSARSSTRVGSPSCRFVKEARWNW